MKNFVLKKAMLAGVLYMLFVVAEMITLVHLDMRVLPTFWYIDISVFLLICLVAFSLPMLGQIIFSIFFLVVHYIFCIVNSCIWSSTARIFEWEMFTLLGETAEAASMIVVPKKVVITLSLLLVGFICLCVFVKRITISPPYKWFIKRVEYVACCVGVALMIGFQPIASAIILNTYDKDEYFISPSFTFATLESSVVGLEEFGFWGYYFNSLTRLAFPSTTPKLKIDSSWYGDVEYTTVLDGLCKDDNVVFILAESFEQYGISQATTPVLYALQNGIDLSQTGISDFYNVSYNSSGMRTLLRKDFDCNLETGAKTYNGSQLFNNLKLDEVGLKLTDYKSIESTNNSEARVLSGATTAFKKGGAELPKVLGNVGYSTNYIHGNYGDFYWRNSSMKGRFGFQNTLFYDQMEGKIASTGSLNFYLKDSDIINYYLAHQDEYDLINEDKFFTFMMTIATHGGYDMNIGLREFAGEFYSWFDAVASAYPNDTVIKLYESVEDAGLKDIVRSYLASAIDTEWAVAMLIDQLMAEGKWEDTILVFVADHYAYGNNVNQFKKIYMESTGMVDTFIDIDHHTLPCFIYSTKIKSSMLEENGHSREVSHLTTAYDLAPTLLTLLGVEYETYKYLGYPVINKSAETGELVCNKLGYTDTSGYFFDDKYTSINGENLKAIEGLTDEYIESFIDEINNFQRKRYYLLEMTKRGLL